MGGLSGQTTHERLEQYTHSSMKANRSKLRPPLRAPWVQLLWIFLVVLCGSGCDDSPPDADGSADGAALDSGADAGDAVAPCQTDEACVSEEPCLSGRCVEGACAWTRAALDLRSTGLIQLGGVATDLVLSDGQLFVSLGADGLEAWAVEGDAPMLLYARQQEAGEGPFDSLALGGDRLFVTESGPVVRALEAQSGAPIGSWTASDDARSVLPDGDLVVVSTFAKGIAVLEDGGWQDPQRVARLDTPGRAVAVVRAGDRLLVADGLAGLAVVNWAGQRREPTLAAERIETAGRVSALAANTQLAVIAEGGAGLGVIELGPPVSRASTVALGAQVVDVGLLTASLAVAISPEGLWVVDLLDRQTPVVLVELGIEGAAATEPDTVRRVLRGSPARLATDSNQLAITLSDGSLQLFELGCATIEASTPDAGVEP